MDPEIQQVSLSSMQQRPSSRQQQQTTSNADDVVVIDDNSSAPGAGGQVASAPRDIPLERLEKALENACETLATLATNVIDFSFDSQHVLFSKVNELVRDLREIDQRGKNVNATIPLDVIEIIDKGRNPELCTYQMLESCAEASNVVRGKLSAVQDFRNELEKSIEEARTQGNLEPVKEEDEEMDAGSASVVPNVPSNADAQNGF